MERNWGVTWLQVRMSRVFCMRHCCTEVYLPQNSNSTVCGNVTKLHVSYIPMFKKHRQNLKTFSRHVVPFKHLLVNLQVGFFHPRNLPSWQWNEPVPQLPQRPQHRAPRSIGTREWIVTTRLCSCSYHSSLAWTAWLNLCEMQNDAKMVGLMSTCMCSLSTSYHSNACQSWLYFDDLWCKESICTSSIYIEHTHSVVDSPAMRLCCVPFCITVFLSVYKFHRCIPYFIDCLCLLARFCKFLMLNSTSEISCYQWYGFAGFPADLWISQASVPQLTALVLLKRHSGLVFYTFVCVLLIVHVHFSAMSGK